MTGSQKYLGPLKYVPKTIQFFWHRNSIVRMFGKNVYMKAQPEDIIVKTLSLRRVFCLNWVTELNLQNVRFDIFQINTMNASFI